jgi:hypothetical protein
MGTTPIEQARIFQSRAQELERRAALAGGKRSGLRETLLQLADEYRQLAEEAAKIR